MSTYTTGSSDSKAGRNTRKSASLQYRFAYCKIALPTSPGTISAATVSFNATANAGPLGDLSVYAIAVTDSGAWDSSSTVGTLNALTLGTAVNTSITLSSGTGVKDFDILGDSGKGIVKFYTDYPSGGDITICLEWTGSADVPNAVLTGYKLGDDDVGSPEATFSAFDDATNYPYITLTYTAGGGGALENEFFFL